MCLSLYIQRSLLGLSSLPNSFKLSLVWLFDVHGHNSAKSHPVIIKFCLISRARDLNNLHQYFWLYGIHEHWTQKVSMYMYRFASIILDTVELPASIQRTNLINLPLEYVFNLQDRDRHLYWGQTSCPQSVYYSEAPLYWIHLHTHVQAIWCYVKGMAVYILCYRHSESIISHFIRTVSRLHWCMCELYFFGYQCFSAGMCGSGTA